MLQGTLAPCVCVCMCAWMSLTGLNHVGALHGVVHPWRLDRGGGASLSQFSAVPTLLLLVLVSLFRFRNMYTQQCADNHVLFIRQLPVT